MFQDENGKELPMEVAIMLKLAVGTKGSVGTSAPVSLLDWCDQKKDVLLVLERPVPCEDLKLYTQRGCLKEDETKVME